MKIEWGSGGAAYTGVDRIQDERRAERPHYEVGEFELNKDSVVADLLALARTFSPGHRNRNIIDRAVAVLCGRNRVSIPRCVREAVADRQGEQCTYCGSTDGPFHLDHIFPVSRGGADDASNLTLACERCNLAKRDKTLAEWIGL